jgi:hypothetical protein
MTTRRLPPEATRNPALAALDEVASRIEAAWGIGRLERLVSPESAAKFDRARDKLDEAARSGDRALLAKKAAVMQRGWKALEKEAMEAGHRPDAENVWHCEAGGVRYAIVPTLADAAALNANSDGEVAYCLDEVAAALSRVYGASVNSVKAAFPGASVSPVGDDPIPF